MSRRLILFVTLTVLMASFVFIAAPANASNPAATTITGTIRSRIARLRATPGSRGTIMTKLARGQSVIVLGALKHWHWLKIQLQPSGQVGWVASFLVHLNGVRLRSVPIVAF